MISFVRHFFMAVWSIVCITSSIVLMLLLFNRKIPLIMARTIWSPGILFFAGVKLDIKGLDEVNWKEKKPRIVISNHHSFLDIPVICRVIPLNMYWTAKKEIRKMPFIGWYMMATGMIFIDRSDREKAVLSMKKAAQLIRQGKDVFIFPQGRRQVGENRTPFKKGAFYLALDSEAEIIPVYIEGTSRVWSKESLRLKPGTVKVKISAPIDVSGYSHENIYKLIKTAERSIYGEKQEKSLETSIS